MAKPKENEKFTKFSNSLENSFKFLGIAAVCLVFLVGGYEGYHLFRNYEKEHKAAMKARIEADKNSAANNTVANVTVDTKAGKATKSIAEKIAIAAPVIREAIKECPAGKTPPPPAMLSALWGEEERYCMGLPDEKCDVSSADARGPLQHTKASTDAWNKDGLDIETLSGAFRVTVRHLCKAKGQIIVRGKKVAVELEPSSDNAILRYHGDPINTRTKYLENVRARQAAHEKIWAQINAGTLVAASSKNAVTTATSSVSTPVLVNAVTPPPAGYSTTPHGNFFNQNGQATAKLFPGLPLKVPATWFSAWGNVRGAHEAKLRPHAGNDYGCDMGQDVTSICDGVVTTAAHTSGNAGTLVAVECSDGKYRGTSMHLKSFSVTVGQRVAANQVIAACGNSGNAAGGAAHVHFQLAKKDGKEWRNVNPCFGEEPSDTVMRCNEIMRGARYSKLTSMPGV